MVSSVQYILCRLADVRKSTISMLKKLQKRVWKEDGDSLPDSTLAYSEMPGELDKIYMNKQHEKAMTAPINPKEQPVVDPTERLREKGLL